MDNEERQPPPMTGKPADIPVPSLGTPEPSGPIPPPPFSGEIGGEPRQRRGRRTSKPGPEAPPQTDMPPASAEIPQENIDALASAISSAFSVVFEIVASIRGEHWKPDPKKMADIGASGAIAMAPHMNSAAKYMPLAIFGLNVAGAVLPPLRRDAELAKELGKDKPTERLTVLP